MMNEEVWYEATNNFEVSNEGNVRNQKTGRLINSENIRIGDTVITTRSFVVDFFTESETLHLLNPLFLLHGNCKSYLIKAPNKDLTRVFHLKTYCLQEGLNYSTVITNLGRDKQGTDGYIIKEMK